MQVSILNASARCVRPTEVELLLGDPTKAKTKLGWKLEMSFDVRIHCLGRSVASDTASRLCSSP
jgi:GDPmannose 4,6-dehydratase